MKRVAILIESGESKYGNLAGPAVDVARFDAFLLSPHGGAWEESEIIKLDGPNEWDLELALMQAQRADISVVLFAGHGAMDDRGRTMLCLSDDFEPDVGRLRTQAEKQLLIVDACRAPTTPSPAPRIILGADTGAIEDRRYRSSCKRVYEIGVAAATEKITLLLSCSPGQYSYDTQDGGVFSSTLLEHCDRCVDMGAPARSSGVASKWLPTRSIFPVVANAVAKREPRQRPQILPSASPLASVPIVVW